ncbi:MAG: hypothetical protein LBH44_01470, partial [Treponema sp.]|nr:hypothetical protein [Treponema sp.]
MKKASQLDKEKAGKNLAAILNRISEADPALLDEYRKLFQKEVSLFRRSWAAAWLFMYYDKLETPSGKNGFSQAKRHSEKSRRQETG